MYQVWRSASRASLAKGLVELFENDEWSMTDVTLACEGQFIQAHRLVLAISSPFFKRFLKMNRLDKGGPVLIGLANVKYDDLKALVHLMYYGKATVSEENYADFLNAVKLFEMESFIDLKSGDVDSEALIAATNESLNPQAAAADGGNLSGAFTSMCDETGVDSTPQTVYQSGLDLVQDESLAENYYPEELASEEEIEIKNIIETVAIDPISGPESTNANTSVAPRKQSKPGKKRREESRKSPGIHGRGGETIQNGETRFLCLCGCSFLRKAILNRHFRDKASTIFRSCETCGKIFSSRRCLQTHRKKQRCPTLKVNGNPSEVLDPGS